MPASDRLTGSKRARTTEGHAAMTTAVRVRENSYRTTRVTAGAPGVVLSGMTSPHATS